MPGNEARAAGAGPSSTFAAVVAVSTLFAALWASAQAVDPAAERVARGRFTVEVSADGDPVLVDGVATARHRLLKRFEGAISGSASGHMLTATSTERGSAGYVAIEQVIGALDGRSGSFVLQHSGRMDRGDQQLSIHVVPGSGTGELVGLRGRFELEIRGREHLYALHYRLPGGGPEERRP